ncbi:MAG: DUF4149 domain-containing protein [Actinomycetota bacterium]|nr:DUF4149 domain-containing protein [Actinomycetota bacterium]
MILDIVVHWLHLLAAFTWVGGLIFVNVVLTPAMQPKGIPPQFVRLMGMERFRAFAWGSIIILVITGVYKAVQTVPDISDLTTSAYGLTLLIKITAVAMMVAITVVNSIVLRRRITQAPAGPGGTPPVEMQTMGRRLVILSRLNLGLGLLVVLLATMLKFGL